MQLYQNEAERERERGGGLGLPEQFILPALFKGFMEPGREGEGSVSLVFHSISCLGYPAELSIVGNGGSAGWVT